MIEKGLAAIVLAVCALLLVRLLIGARHRHRLDTALRGAARVGQRAVQACQRAARSAWHWRGARRASKQAADEAIRRARGGGTWDGNVYKPKSFRKPPRDKMH